MNAAYITFFDYKYTIYVFQHLPFDYPHNYAMSLLEYNEHIIAMMVLIFMFSQNIMFSFNTKYLFYERISVCLYNPILIEAIVG